MALRDIFKKKKIEKKEKIVTREAELIKEKSVKRNKTVKKQSAEKIEKDKEEQKRPAFKRETVKNEAYQILKSPHITEKATDLAKKNQYIFKVYPDANKIEIKKAIEDIYRVNVVGVNVIKIFPKKRKLGRITGWRKGYKKAIIKIREGQKIEVLPR